MHNNTTASSDDLKRLREIIKDIKTAMLTTVDTEGHLRSRPMVTQQADFDGDLWFFSRSDTPKVAELRTDSRVNVCYANPSDDRYVSVSGRVQVVRDRAKAVQLWNPVYQARFPKGLEDPSLVLLRVKVEIAEYWDRPSGKLVEAVQFVKSKLGGDSNAEPELGEHKKISMTG